MRKFLVKIWAYDHYASFEVEAEDNAEADKEKTTVRESKIVTYFLI